MLCLPLLIILHLLTLFSIVSVYSEILAIESRKNSKRLGSFYKEEKVFSKIGLFLILCFIPVLPLVVLGNLFLRFKYLEKPVSSVQFYPSFNVSGGPQLKKAEKKPFKSSSKIQLNSSENNWNNLYKCSCCDLFSRRYQSVSGSSLNFVNHCQFCGKDDSLELITDEKYNLLEDLQFAEKIPFEKVVSHMKSISDKWLTLEKRKEEFEKNKFITEMKIHQIKAYEKLKSEDLSEKISLYELKLEENLKEMEEFKDNLLKEM